MHDGHNFKKVAACTITVQAVLFVAYIEVIAQFVLTRSFEQHFANASLAQWLDYMLGLLDRWFDSLCCSYFFTFFATQLLVYYNIAIYSVSFAAQQL